MNILIAHNYYQNPGGEDYVFRAEAAMLESHGHNVIRYSVHNDDVANMSRLSLAQAAIWNRRTYRELRHIFRTHHTEVAHFHNTLALISPAAYYAAQAENVAVVQTLHNYRLYCLPGTFYRDGHVCEDCFMRFPVSGIQHSCYRNSKAQSMVVAGMLGVHRTLRTYHKQVNRYIVLTEYARRKFSEGGIDPSRISIKPNFLDEDPGIGQDGGDYMLYVGRLVEEKGVLTMLEAWRQLPDIPLMVLGDGPLMQEMQDYIAEHNMTHVMMMGQRRRNETLTMMKQSLGLVFPSQWNEPFGLSIVEAYACGKPVIASELGAPTSLVIKGETGEYFKPGDADDLATQARSMWESKQSTIAMGHNARQKFTELYTADRNYKTLIEIYQQALDDAHQQVNASSQTTS
ncbi:glycosyltransferase family 4 protein [Phototrophicus methaneseepsis]|uniref:Glycosyltransferase family 4 protein n=1 Tax=Phototrophicus methaneseepsis TaxID=2710758 RepID=A0A7S8EBL8_9CHLR|nr:glycosyltransferase family 4 protein [Phototrophicus methaneseepsis]QPC83988.1 glycosyltransferase family 4 protein [Phototrophicus methaneseepsis]